MQANCFYCKKRNDTEKLLRQRFPIWSKNNEELYGSNHYSYFCPPNKKDLPENYSKERKFYIVKVKKNEEDDNWKCVVQEKKIIWKNFKDIDGKNFHEAESHVVYQLVQILKDEKWKGKATVYSCLPSHSIIKELEEGNWQTVLNQQTSSDTEYYRNLALAYSLLDNQIDLTLEFKGDLSREEIIELSKNSEDPVIAFLKDINNSPCWKALGKVLALDLSGNSTTALYLVEEKIDRVQKYSFNSKIPSVHLARIKKQIASLQPDLILVIFEQGKRYEKREECITLHQVHKGLIAYLKENEVRWLIIHPNRLSEYKKVNPLNEFIEQDFANRHEIDAYYLYQCYRDQAYEGNEGSGFNLEPEVIWVEDGYFKKCKQDGFTTKFPYKQQEK